MSSTVTPANAPKLVNVPTAAKALGISDPFLRTLIRRGDMPGVRIGRRLLVRVRDIEAVVERGGLAGKVDSQ